MRWVVGAGRGDEVGCGCREVVILDVGVDSAGRE